MEIINKIYDQDSHISLIEYLDEESVMEKIVPNLNNMSPVVKGILIVVWAAVHFILRIIEFVFTLVTAPFAILADLFKNIFIERKIEILEGLELLKFRILGQMITIFTEPIGTLKSFKNLTNDDKEVIVNTAPRCPSMTDLELSSISSDILDISPQ
ncbi:MAG: hypothetical protein S4CHLAM20_01710 [Chlamydiia bacterium]|nr:hypothetical protein [Chlamydiia bacterium]